MSWTNLVILSLGLAIGAGVGWFIGRSQASATQRNTNKADGASEASEAIGAILPTSIPSNSETQNSEMHHSELQTLEQQLQRTQMAYQMARQMAQFQAGFLARTSHELRSPINSVISLHQLILADLAEDPAEEREFVTQASNSAQKMLALLDQLIGVSKAAYGTETLHFQSLSLWEALAETEQFTQMQAKNRNLRLNIELPEPDILVWADRKWLQQTLLILVDTPIRLMEEGHIRLTTQSLPDLQQAHIYIEDERPASFWQESIDLLDAIKADKTLEQKISRATVSEGNSELSPGLGLLVAQALLELMGGHLEILSVPAILSASAIAKNANNDAVNHSTDNTNATHTMTRIRFSLPLAKP